METEAARQRGERAGDQSDVMIAFRDDVQVEFAEDAICLAGPASSFVLRPVRGGILVALRRLAAGPASLLDVLGELLPAERVQFHRVLDRAGHLIVRSLMFGQHELVQVVHTARDADYRPVPVSVDTPVRLSRFAFCRSRDDGLVLESPLATVRVLLVSRAARELVAALGTARTPTELATDLTVATTAELLGHLIGAGFAEVADPAGRFASDEDPTLRQWDFHDLLFHSRVRSGRYDDPLGAVYPYVGQIPPKPAIKQVPDGRVIALYRPELEQILAHDPALTSAIEMRRSIRDYGDAPMTARQLGEFLYRVARVRAHFQPGPGEGDEVVSRPYPSGGSAYELELYLTVRRCAGVAEGIYYYDPVGHALVLVNEEADDRAAMLAVASVSTGLRTSPDVLITLTSRFQRLSWKYRAIAYATTLRHTGVVYQTMYLVATAMGLAPCGLGNGSADLSVRALRLDYLTESSVGDFLLGSRPPQASVDGPPPPGWRTVNGADWIIPTAGTG